MATSKTLTPTNVTISIPEFTDQPDQRVNSNGIDKLADAVNALNTHVENLSATTISNLSDVPVNSQGRLTFNAGVSPTGSQLAANYQCYGSSTRRTITITDVGGSSDYVSYYNGSSWTTWKRLSSIVSDTASGTTDGYGFISSGKAITSRKILSARVSTPTTGIAATPVQIGTNWQFLCTTIDNGYIKPYTSSSVTVTYFYVE